jgi:hypothetical protein
MRKQTGGRSARNNVAVMLPTDISTSWVIKKKYHTGIDEREEALFTRTGGLGLFNELRNCRIGGWIICNTLIVFVAMVSR